MRVDAKAIARANLRAQASVPEGSGDPEIIIAGCKVTAHLDVAGALVVHVEVDQADDDILAHHYEHRGTVPVRFECNADSVSVAP
jgi:hypothetical protein